MSCSCTRNGTLEVFAGAIARRPQRSGCDLSRYHAAACQCVKKMGVGPGVARGRGGRYEHHIPGWVRRWLDRRRSRNHRVQCRITIWHCRLDAARITPTPPTLFLAKRGGVRRRRTSAHSDPPFFCMWFRGGSEPDRGGVGSKPPRRRHAEDGVGGCDRGAAAVVRG